MPVRPRMAPALSTGAAALLVFGVAAAPLCAQDPPLAPLVEYRSRLDVEPRVQSRVIMQRCTALYGLLAGWVERWDPDGAAAFRRGAGAFREAAAGEGDEGARAILEFGRRYGEHMGTAAPTAPRLQADALLAGDLGVCGDLLDVVGGTQARPGLPIRDGPPQLPQEGRALQTPNRAPMTASLVPRPKGSF